MGSYSNTRPDSPKGQIYIAFSTQGHSAARAKAEALKIPAGKVNRWFGEWAGDEAKAPAGDPVEAPKTAAEPAKPATPTKVRGKGKASTPKAARERVYDVGEPNVHGTIIEKGEQVSTVRWDVSQPWGKEKHVSNEMLRPVDDEPGERERYAFANAKAFRVMRKDTVIANANSFQNAIATAGDDCSLWVFAVSKGGSVALLMRPHWPQYEALAKS